MSPQTTRASFADVIASTQCPFAKRGRLHYGTAWASPRALTEQTSIWGQEMAEFVELIPLQNPDGFVIGGVGEHVPATLQELSTFVCNVLTDLTTMNRGSALTQREVTEEGWQFSFKGTRMFLVVMSSVYPKTNSRHSPVPASVFLFFQPEPAFDNFMPHPEHDPRTQRLKVAIRQDFARAGKAYDIAIVADSSEAAKYVKPRNMGNPVVEWWKNL